MNRSPALNPLRIGGLCLDTPLLLAPMAGYSDAAMRTICRQHGCALGFTEVANAAALTRGSRPTYHLLETDPAERPVVAHLYGCDPDVMARAAERVAALERFDAIDLNCGCPVRKIVNKGCGVALMRNPRLVGQIVKAMAAAAPLPVTVKTRLGIAPETPNAVDVAREVQEAGGAALFVHARFASSRHGGEPDWAALGAIKSACAIPVVGNGGVRGGQDALRMLAISGVDGIMVGRGAIGNPWVFAGIAAALRGETTAGVGPAAVREAVAAHLAGLLRLMDIERSFRRRPSFSADRAAARHFRGHLVRYLAGYRGWAEVRRCLDALSTTAEILQIVDSVLTER